MINIEALAPNNVSVVSAKLEDIDTVLSILDEAASWIIEQGLPSAWKPGEFSRQAFLIQIARGEVYIAFVHGKACRNSYSPVE